MLPVSRSAPGLPAVITPAVRMIGGIVGTRRGRGGVAAADRPGPGGDRTTRLEDTGELTASFRVGFISDIVLVLTVAAATPAWP